MDKELEYETDGEVFIKHPENVRIGEGVFIGHGTFVDGYHDGPGIDISSGAWIGQQCYLHGAGGIFIGPMVGIAPCVKIFTSTHCHDFVTGDIPIIRSPLNFEPVSINRHSDIGVGSIIMPGVQIGTGAVVGAGSVVTHDVPSDWIASGNPARMIRRREL